MINKKGSEIVEASIVLPVLILIVAALVGLSMYYYNSYIGQCAVQRELVESSETDSSMAKIIRNSRSYSSRIGGAYGGWFGRDYSQRRYVLDEAAMIRAGELLV